MAYYLSMGYGNDLGGIVLKNSYDRYNFNGKIDVTEQSRIVRYQYGFLYQTSKGTVE